MEQSGYRVAHASDLGPRHIISWIYGLVCQKTEIKTFGSYADCYRFLIDYISTVYYCIHSLLGDSDHNFMRFTEV